MKKTQIAFIIATAIFLCMLIGIFIGRNSVNPLKFPSNNNLSSTQQSDVRIDINTATHAQLTLLPGIGDELAGRIIDYRTQNGPFTSIAELLCIQGIGKSKLENIQDYIKTGG